MARQDLGPPPPEGSGYEDVDLAPGKLDIDIAVEAITALELTFRTSRRAYRPPPHLKGAEAPGTAAV